MHTIIRCDTKGPLLLRGRSHPAQDLTSYGLKWQERPALCPFPQQPDLFFWRRFSCGTHQFYITLLFSKHLSRIKDVAEPTVCMGQLVPLV